MDSIKSKVSYINGLVDGLDIDLQSKEGRIIKELINVLADVAEEIEEIKDAQNDIQDYMDNIDENINLLEDEIYDDDFEDCDCDDIENFIDFKCPACGEKVYIDTKILEDKEQVVCPSCHESIPVEAECEESCHGCCDCNDLND